MLRDFKKPRPIPIPRPTLHGKVVDFRPHRVAALSLWLGLLATERTLRVFEAEPDKYAGMRDLTESPEFAGRVIDALARDPALMDRSGRVWIAAELAEQYGVRDTDGRQPASPRRFFGDPTEFGEAVVE